MSKYTINYLLSLKNNPKELKDEVIFSRGLVYYEFNKNNIEITKEMLTGENFNVLGIYELDKILKKEGLKKSEISKIINKEYLEAQERDSNSIQRNLDQIAKHNLEEFLSIVENNKYDLIKKSDLLEKFEERKILQYIDVDNILNASTKTVLALNNELKDNIKNGEFNIFLNNLSAYENHPAFQSLTEIKKAAEEKFNDDFELMIKYDMNNDSNELSKLLTNWLSFLADDRFYNTYPYKEKKELISKITSKISYGKIPQEFISIIDISSINYVDESSLSKLRKDFELFLEDSEMMKNISWDSFSFNIFNALKLDVNNEDDRKLMIKYVNQFNSHNSLKKAFINSKFYKNTSDEDIKKYFPILTDNYLNLNKNEQVEDFVIEKIKQLYVKNNNVCISYLSNFFNQSDNLNNNLFVLNEIVLEKMIKDFKKNNIKINFDNVAYQRYDNQSKAFISMQIINAVEKYDKSVLSEDINLGSLASFFEMLVENDYHNYKLVSSHFSVIKEFEENMFKIIQKHFMLNKNDSHVLTSDVIEANSEEFRSILTSALITKNGELMPNEMLAIVKLLTTNVSYSRNYHNDDEVANLLNEGFTIEDFLGVENHVINKTGNEKEIYEQIKNSYENGAYKLKNRRGFLDSRLLTDVYLLLLSEKIEKKEDFKSLTDVEYGNMVKLFLNSIDSLSYTDVYKNIKNKFKKIEKMYPGNGLINENVLINKNNLLSFDNNIISNCIDFKPIFLNQFKNINKFNDDELSFLIKYLIELENSTYSNRDEISLFYDVINLSVKMDDFKSYEKSNQLLLKLEKAKDYESFTSLVVKKISSALNIQNYTFENFITLSDKDENVLLEYLEKIGFVNFNNVKNYEYLINNNMLDKLKVIVDKFGGRKETQKEFQNLELNLQLIMLDYCKNITLEADKHYSNTKGCKFGLNCKTVSDLEKIREVYRPKEQYNLIRDGGKYYGKQDIVLWEGGKIFDMIVFNEEADVKGLVDYIIEHFPVSTMEYYNVANFNRHLKHNLSGQEILTLYRNIKNKTGSIFNASNDSNADFNWLSILTENNEKVEDFSNLLGHFFNTLEQLKEEPLLYIFYISENRRFIDRIKNFIEEKKDQKSYTNHEFNLVKVSPKLSPLYELSEMIKENPHTKKMFTGKYQGLDEDYLLNIVLNKFCDFDTIKQGITQGFREYYLYKEGNYRLFQSIEHFYQYSFFYSEKLNRDKQYGETKKNTTFTDNQLIEIIRSVVVEFPEFIYMYGPSRLFYSLDESNEKLESLTKNELSENDAKKLLNCLMEYVIDNETAKKMLNAEFNHVFMSEFLIEQLFDKLVDSNDNSFVDEVRYSEAISEIGEKYLKNEITYNCLQKDKELLCETIGYNLLGNQADESLKDYVNAKLNEKTMELDLAELNKKAVTTKKKSVKF